jgi:prophage DNA circulation protein
MSRQKWKDKLRPAKFRNLAFYVDTSSYSTGRRGQLHEFPGRDIPYREDLGRKGKVYSVEGYILGSNYRTLKDGIISACEKEGPGELVHPYYGKVAVCCEELSVHESAGEGGFCKFSFKFVEAGEVKFPTSLLDTDFLVAAAADALGTNAMSALENTLSVVGKAQYIVDSAADKVTAFADFLSDTTSGISGAAADIANLAFSIRDLKAKVRDILGTPAQLAQQMNSALDFLVKAANPNDIFKACKDMFNFGSSDASINRTTANRRTQAENLNALNTAVQILSLSKAAVATSQILYSSTEEAIAAREVITGQIDAQSESTLDDELYVSLQNLRAEIVRAIPAPDQNLARVAEYTPTATMPTLALLYDRYGSLDLENDLLTRNRIRNPGFIRGGVALEILDRG